MKNVSLEYGSGQVALRLPDRAEVLRGPAVKPLANPAGAIADSLARPIGTAPLAELADGADSAAIVVSDNTRPAPYQGPEGTLRPIIELLQQRHVTDIRVIVATGTHRRMDEQELHAMLDESAFRPGVRVINHVCTDGAMLRQIGSTSNTPRVTVNRHYLDADLKILTGLVEPHFMAGYSGGRKAVCPGICGRSVTHGFHSATMLDNEDSTSLKLNGNPCHEEALRIARMAGVDFILNVTIDQDKRVVGVFGGELEDAHLTAAAHCKSFASVPIRERYDVVLTHGGYVGLNHYQCAKAAIEAARALKPGGVIVMLANLWDSHPVGNDNYRELLRLLASCGAEAFTSKILSESWSFVPDQWEVQMWAKVFMHLGDPKRLYTCGPRLGQFGPDEIPETNVAAQCPRTSGESESAWVQRLAQQTIEQLLPSHTDKSILVLPDGPYAVPILTNV